MDEEFPPGRMTRRHLKPRLAGDVGPALSGLARQTWEDSVGDEVLRAFSTLAGAAPDVALTQLRRLETSALREACRRTLSDGTLTLPALWAASSVRPLRTAVDGLDPALREHFGQLSLLFGEPPMPKSLRTLVRLAGIADAYAVDLLAREVRRAIGDLTIQDHPVITRALTSGAPEPLLCALTVLVTCQSPSVELANIAAPRAITVPGYPAAALDDETGPWQSAFPAARELGADTSAFWDEIAAHGLRVPASWLAAVSWPTLWSRAHR
jgi:hypothetical protein